MGNGFLILLCWMIKDSNIRKSILIIIFSIVIKSFQMVSLAYVGLTFLTLVVLIIGNDKISYLSTLLHQKQQIQQKIQQVKSIHDKTIANLLLSQNTTYQQKVLQAAIHDQRSLLLNAYSSTFYSHKLISDNCSNGNVPFTINAKIQQLQNQISKVEGLQLSSTCLKNRQIEYRLSIQRQLLQGMKRQINPNCSQVEALQTNIPFLDIGQSKFIDNEKTQYPWVYGLINEQTYALKNSQLVNLYGAAQCPEENPFLDGNNNCFKCSQGQIYDISLKKCFSCPQNSQFDAKQRFCRTKIMQLNSNTTSLQNYIGKPPLTIPTLKSCSTQQPYFNGQACISCSLPMYYSFITNTCETCQQDSVFNIKTKGCVSNVFYQSNLAKSQNYIGSSLSPLPYDKIKSCSEEKPFSNGKECSACQLPMFYNFIELKCQNCPNSLSFDVNTHSCISSSGTSNFINSNLVSNRNFMGKIPLYNNLFKSCADSTPFFNGVQCIQCNQPMFFSFDTLSCSSCPTGLQFSPIIQNCEYSTQDYYTNIESNRIYYNGDYSEIATLIQSKKQMNPNAIMCTIETPFYDSKNNICIQCSNDYNLFDFKANKCINCPSGSEFNEQGHICLAKSAGATIQRMIMNTA